MRLFVAIPMPESVKNNLAELRRPIDGVRWQQKDKLHLTLKFLGDTNPDRLPNLKIALDRIETSSFSITLQGLGYFPKGNYPRVLWAGIKKNQSLQELYRSIEQKCTDLGFEAEQRSFKPHITIARIEGGSKSDIMSFINQNKEFNLQEVPVEEFVLYESKLNPDGAEHHRIKTFPLQG